MKRSTVVLFVATVATSSPVLGFELVTHAAITQSAYNRFLRDSPDKVADLGVLSFLSDPQRAPIFGHVYYDVSIDPAAGRLALARHDWRFEGKIIEALGGDALSISGWLMRGAIREDDGVWSTDDNPQDDPYSPGIRRYTNHFFDPPNNKPLTVSLYGVLGAKAPDWATGTTDAFKEPNKKAPGRRNHFTVFDAQEAMFNALTLKTSDPQGNVVDLVGASDPASRQAARKAYWATTFRALGDVLHLNQDMAQPQHTRNEAHSGAYQVGLGHASFFEKYLDARALPDQPSFAIKDLFRDKVVVPITWQRLHLPQCDGNGQNCGDYPLPSPLASVLSKYSDFWSTTPGGTGGVGMADYSNAGFFSAVKNLASRENEYNLPPNDSSTLSYKIETIPPTRWDGTPLAGPPVYVYKRDVPDHLNPTQTAAQVPLTSYSMWDEFMRNTNQTPTFHLIRENYDAQEELLIPRAVAYSAGLLEYFFRGSMQISLPPEGAYAVIDQHAQRCIDNCGFKLIKLTLKNTTPNEDMTTGSLLAVAKFHRNTCYQEDLSGEPGGPAFNGLSCRSPAEEIVVSNPVAISSLLAGRLAYGATQAVTFTFPAPIPINATDLYLQVVFRGTLGNETDAVVVTTKNISEPNYIAHTNVSDYAYDYTTHSYHLLPYAGHSTSLVDFGVSVLLGNAVNPIATLSTVTAPQQAQLAYLTDTGTQWMRMQTIQANYNPVWGLGVNNHIAEFIFNSGSGHYYRSVLLTPSRDVLRDFFVFTTLPLNSEHPFPPCSDEPELCDQSTMPALTPGTIVEWTINPTYVPN